MAATRQTVQSNASTNVKTSIFEKISYGMGDVACNVVFALTSGLITYFYTNVMSVSAAMVGMIMLISRIFDGISDVAIGLIMDKVHSKHGRGRAWVLWMALPYGISAVALFCLPANATAAVQAIYIFITYNLCTTVVYTALNLPYGAMAPLMTSNEQDLARINLFRMAMSPIGNMIVSAASLPIINRMGGDQAAWIKVTLIYSVVAIGLLLWCFFGTKERVNTQAAQILLPIWKLRLFLNAKEDGAIKSLVDSPLGASQFQSKRKRSPSGCMMPCSTSSRSLPSSTRALAPITLK